MKEGYYQFDLYLTKWTVPQRYQNFQAIGSGAFGCVCSALDTETNQQVAIKKLHRPFQSAEHAKRTFRELTLLRRMNHDYVIKLLNVFTPDESVDQLKEVYIVTPRMDTDLAKILRGQRLGHGQVQCLIYQMLCGLKYIHSAGIIHRDLKPANMGIDTDECELRILDFGLARLAAKDMTGYVTTRWYRAPEILYNWIDYERTADIWSVGCIMAEMITGIPLFPGKESFEQLHLIIKLVGSPTEEFMGKITSDEARTYIREKVPRLPKSDFKKVFVGAPPDMIDLLEKMLVLDPELRITASDALAHPYFGQLHDPNDEPTSAPLIDLAFEHFCLTVQDWRELIWKEIKDHEITAPYLEEPKDEPTVVIDKERGPAA